MKILKFILGVMRTNCYFLVDERTSECAVVDPAYSAETIYEKLTERSLKVKFIILTHAHFDHMMAADPLRELTGAPLYVHRLDAPGLSDPHRSYMLQFTGNPTTIRPADRLLEDGDVLEIGGEKIKVMHTPGHTTGSICLICGDTIITGDTLMRDTIGRYDFDGGDYGVLLQSLKKLSDLDGDYHIYPGHGASTTLQRERDNNIYM